MDVEGAVRRRGVAGVLWLVDSTVAAGVTAGLVLVADQVVGGERISTTGIVPDAKVAAAASAVAIGVIGGAVGVWLLTTWLAYRRVCRRGTMQLGRLQVWEQTERQDWFQRKVVPLAPTATSSAPRRIRHSALIPVGADEPTCRPRLRGLDLATGSYDVGIVGEARPRRWVILLLGQDVVLPSRRTAELSERHERPPWEGPARSLPDGWRARSSVVGSRRGRDAVALFALGSAGVVGAAYLATITAPALAALLAVAGWALLAAAAALVWLGRDGPTAAAGS